MQGESVLTQIFQQKHLIMTKNNCNSRIYNDFYLCFLKKQSK